ncbi:MAG: DNA/RNA nuclease SfsA [Candidatus Thorarchaeota archaeon]|jgi:sugar fermentation stimulation protein A
MWKPGEVMEAKLIDRPNRFLGRVEIGGTVEEAFIPNPGRMYELMIPGKTVFVRHKLGEHRKTRLDMIAVSHEGVLISIDSNLPNRFMKGLLENHQLDVFSHYVTVMPEPRLFGGRLDFRLDGPSGTTLIEVKSCTLVEEGHARFPDAPTDRGTRHMRHLAESLHTGIASRAAVVFVIQRPDARVFSPNDETDPDFGEALRDANKCGVEIIPLSTEIRDWCLSLIGIIPFEL